MKCQLITRKPLLINSKTFEFIECAYTKQEKASKDGIDKLHIQVCFFLSC